MNKVELLAPAGDIECFYAAINAGADAVYLAGKSFGARASATNFTTEELIECLDYAHVRGKKIYLTFNTLIKEREWSTIYDFILPLYEAGLDGIIIQDIGLIDYLKKAFPLLPLHASTQMTVTDAASALWLKERGIERIVPARELSLTEIEEIKKKSGLEIETFIHGALCYSYSGQCLYSSFLGGRSGNRGRCAGPCRLPYNIFDKNGNQVGKNIEYPLSLKDLCIVNHIDKLIKAGIDSFKIEGRMKSCEYVAGVTSIYRKYIDEFYETGNIAVSDDDMEVLKQLYLRSSVGSGYYFKHNGADMITAHDPSYNTQNDKAVTFVRENILNKKVVRPVDIEAYFAVGEIARLSMKADDICVTVTGEKCEASLNAEATVAGVTKQLCKLGNTGFCANEVKINLSPGVFLPVGELNNLRRVAVEQLSNGILKSAHRKVDENVVDDCLCEYTKKETIFDNTLEGIYDISIRSEAQFKLVLDYDVRRIYVPYDMICKKDADFLNDVNIQNKQIYIELPRIVRLRDNTYMQEAINYVIGSDLIAGVLVHNLEELYYLKESSFNKSIVCDSTLYGWNRASHRLLSEIGETIAPVELSMHELNDIDDKNLIIPAYGYVPLMVTANCIRKTLGKCTGSEYDFEFFLSDRYKKEPKVFVNCTHCYNEIFNPIPNSIHKMLEQYMNSGYRKYLISFTLEKPKQCKQVLDYYVEGITTNPPSEEYTVGHGKKGAI